MFSVDVEESGEKVIPTNTYTHRDVCFVYVFFSSCFCVHHMNSVHLEPKHIPTHANEKNTLQFIFFVNTFVCARNRKGKRKKEIADYVCVEEKVKKKTKQNKLLKVTEKSSSMKLKWVLDTLSNVEMSQS